MRLNQIKLSGFKSFAEPTTFQLPGQRVGVVGPNGCGKSNIMDAVRWVLGESKASELRGESMQDVIFNGSGHRKPASRASVELVFSNEDARAGGQWNAFTEIAVKRVLTRDGTSSYFINNQPVRRRDVQDVFLGTGLGPRAYAIIGQGTISRIIESRPEELRLFLEEAAGVSKYKERRRETENRLKDTRENLTRVEDILRELNNNLDKLEKQAEVATRYRGLQDQGTLKLHQLWFLKQRDAAQEEQRVKTATAEATTALEARLAELRHVELELETLRQAHYAASDALHLKQGALAEAALEVSRLEERIRYVVEGRQRAEQRLADLQAQNEPVGQRETEADGRAGRHRPCRSKVPTNRPRCWTARPRSRPRSCRRWKTPCARAVARQRAAQRRGAGAAADPGAGRRQPQHRRAGAPVARPARPPGHRAPGPAGPTPQRLAQLQQQHAAAAELQEPGRRTPARTERAGAGAGRAAPPGAGQRQPRVGRLADLGARLDALRALQEKVQTEGKLKPWLARHGLDGLAGLWTRCTSRPAGKRARIRAARTPERAVGRPARHGARLRGRRTAGQAGLLFAAAGGTGQHAPHAAAAVRQAAPERRRPEGAAGRLAGRRVHRRQPGRGAGRRDRLTHGEVIMTREGHAVSQFAVSFYAPDSEQAGMLARAQEIENLDRERRAQALIADEARSASVRAEAAYTDASQRLLTARREASEAQTRAHQLQVELLRLTQQAEATDARRAQLEEELAEIDAQLEVAGRTPRHRRGALRGTGPAAGPDPGAPCRAGRRGDRPPNAGWPMPASSSARWNARRRKRASRRGRWPPGATSCTRHRHRAQRRSRPTCRPGSSWSWSWARFNDAAAQAGLQTALALKLEREQAAGRHAQRVRRPERQAARRPTSSACPSSAAWTRCASRSPSCSWKLQAAQLGGAQYLEQLTPPAPTWTRWRGRSRMAQVKLWGLQTEIDRIQKDIAALGAVNLAALDELTQLARAQDLPRCAERRPAGGHPHAGRRHPQDRPGDARPAGADLQPGQRHFGRMFPSLFGGGNAGW
jgi:chromosome segregation protein